MYLEVVMNINGLYLRNSLFFLLFFGVGVVPNASPKPSEGQPKCLERLAQAVDDQKKVQKRLNKCKKVCNKNKLQEDCDQYWDDQLKALQRAKHFPAEIDESGSTLNVNPGGTFIVKFRWDQPAPEPGNNDSWMVLFHPQEADETLWENWQQGLMIHQSSRYLLIRWRRSSLLSGQQWHDISHRQVDISKDSHP